MGEETEIQEVCAQGKVTVKLRYESKSYSKAHTLILLHSVVPHKSQNLFRKRGEWVKKKKKVEIIIYKLNMQMLVSQEQIALSFCTKFHTWDRYSFLYVCLIEVYLTSRVASYRLN